MPSSSMHSPDPLRILPPLTKAQQERAQALLAQRWESVAREIPATPLADVFARWMKAAKPSAGTVRRYKGGLKRLAEFGIHTLADACDRQRLSRFYESRRAVTEGSTANTDISSLTTLTDYLERAEGIPPEGTTALLRMVRRRLKRVDRVRLTFLELDEVETLARAARTLSPILELAVWVVYWAGLRTCELRRLMREHMDLGEKPVARVLWLAEELGADGTIKTWREREVPIEAPLKALLLDRAPPAGYIFPSFRPHSHGRERKIVSYEWLDDNLRKAARLSGITRVKIDWMLLRRSCACRWINSGVDEAKLVDAMGHTPETFRRYYKQMRGGYDKSFETTLPKAHRTEQETKKVDKAPQGRTTTRPLTKSDLTRLHAAERALLKTRAKGRAK